MDFRKEFFFRIDEKGAMANRGPCKGLLRTITSMQSQGSDELLGRA